MDLLETQNLSFCLCLQLNYNTNESSGPSVAVQFKDTKTPVSLPVEKAIDVAFDALKSSNTEAYYRRQAWEVIKCYLVATMNLEDDKQTLMHLFNHLS